MPYSEIPPDELILRDRLAGDRTVLANERTFLAYIRTAIMLLVSGITLVKLFPNDSTLLILGSFLIPVGFGVVVIGYIRFCTIQRRLEFLRKKPKNKDVNNS